ncbi:MAG: hypothetical protein ACK5MY_06800 [Jhaorihella sp.]
MKTMLSGAIAALALIAASALAAAPLKLTPANPQPGAPKPGLSVVYGFAPEGEHIKTLADARAMLRTYGKRGSPLSGLDYRDGQPTLTSKRAENVAAQISGYVRFDEPGIYDVDFLTNDGLDMRIGGQRVGLFDGRQTCDSILGTQVEVPKAGWYKLDGVYFNRLNTSCLHMRWAKAGGKMSWVPDSAFGY